MTDLVRLGSIIALLALALSACGGQTATPDSVAPLDRESLDPRQAFDLAWAALEPNTSSHDPANWELAEVRRVSGQEVAAEFGDEQPGYGCPGPTPQPNRPVKASGAYWYVTLKRRPATPPPDVPTISPTAPPLVPEPFIYQAFFLVDAEGEIVARKLFCVIY
jgi:hypothetical protein